MFGTIHLKDIGTVLKILAVWIIAIIVLSCYSVYIGSTYLTPYMTEMLGVSATVAGAIAINELTVMSDVKHSTLDNIVRGLTKNPRVETLHKIALAFNMTLSEFLDFDELNSYSFDKEIDD